MTKIDTDLISNKPSCYVFDIDGVLAEVRDILLTHRQTYEILSKKYEQDSALYDKQMKQYAKDLKAYKNGDRLMRPAEPTRPSAPVRVSENKQNSIDWKYFSDHLLEATPIEGTLNLMINLALTHKVILLTGRSDENRAKTQEWIRTMITNKVGASAFTRVNYQIIMRDTKKELTLSGPDYKKAKINEICKNYNVQLIFEDCPEIIEMYTKLGLLVLSPNKEYYRIGQE